MSNLMVLENCNVFDGIAEEIRDGACVIIEGDTIREVCSRALGLANARRLDCGGRFLMPGLIDLHFHAYSPPSICHGSTACRSRCSSRTR